MRRTHPPATYLPPIPLSESTTHPRPNSERRILQAGERILCRHPFNGAKRCYVTPARVVALLQEVWDGSKAGTGVVRPTPEDPDDVDGVGALFAVRKRAMGQVTDLVTTTSAR